MKRITGCWAVLLAGGWGCHPVPFIPVERITAASAARLVPVYSQLHASYALERLISPDLPCALGRVVIDGASHQMYIHRRAWTGFASGVPTGIYQIDLRSGTIVRRTRFPSRLDMSGEEYYATESCIFNLARQVALFDTGFGGHGAVVLLDLAIDDPRLIEHHTLSIGDKFTIEPAPHPRVDDARFLLVREQMSRRPYGPSHLVYVDVDRRTIVGEYPLAPLARELSYSGGIHDYVLTHRCEQPAQPAELIVLDTAGGEVRLFNRLRLNDDFAPTGTPLIRGWSTPSEIIDPGRQWWITAERSERRSRICVYEVPSLRRIAQLPVAVEDMQFCSETGVLSVIPADEPRTLVLYELPAAKELAQLRLPKHDYAGTWEVVEDPDGLYVGVSGCQWIHLWAVRPAGGR